MNWEWWRTAYGNVANLEKEMNCFHQLEGNVLTRYRCRIYPFNEITRRLIAGEANATGRSLSTPGEPDGPNTREPRVSGPYAAARAVQGGV